MKCHHFLQKHCLSCDLLSHDYLSSMSIKEQKLNLLFPGHADKIKPSVICESGAEGTRNKAKLAVIAINGDIEFGFYDHAMQFKKLEDCPLHAPAINAVLSELKKLLNTNNIIPYDLRSRKGELKYLLVTYSESANELLLRFVLRSTESVERLRKITSQIMAFNSVIKVVTANIQPTHQAILEGDEEIILTSNDCITHLFGEVTLYQGPRSFFQTNSSIALKLYQQFQIEMSGLSLQSFLDLYCGVGAFSFFARIYCQEVVGIEISDAAIFYANKARELNKCPDIQFKAMDAEVFLANQEVQSFDSVMVNPPRRGLNEAIIANLMRLAPQTLFYSSCNVETLQRDISNLAAMYEIKSLQIFDMFPHTQHFETLAVLAKS